MNRANDNEDKVTENENRIHDLDMHFEDCANELDNFEQFQQLWQESPRTTDEQEKPKKRARVTAVGLEDAACIGTIDPPHLRRPARACWHMLGLQN